MIDPEKRENDVAATPDQKSSAAPNFDFFVPRLLVAFPRVLPPLPRPRFEPLVEPRDPPPDEPPPGQAIFVSVSCSTLCERREVDTPLL